MKTKTTRKLFSDEYSRIYEDARGVLHVAMAGMTITPSPSLYPDFTGRDFAELHEELTRSGIPAAVAGRWVNQAQGFDV